MLKAEDQASADMVFAHADAIRAITPEEFACEMRWQDGQGLLEIINNVVGHLEQVKHAGRIKRIVALEDMRGKITNLKARKPKDLSELLLYAQTIEVSEKDAEAFFDSQESGGWTRGGKPLHDWKASLRTWKANSWLPSLRAKTGFVGKPECLKMSWPRDWQEAKRQVRLLQSKSSDHPEVAERIETMKAQFKLDI